MLTILGAIRGYRYAEDAEDRDEKVNAFIVVDLQHVSTVDIQAALCVLSTRLMIMGFL